MTSDSTQKLFENTADFEKGVVRLDRGPANNDSNLHSVAQLGTTPAAPSRRQTLQIRAITNYAYTGFPRPVASTMWFEPRTQVSTRVPVRAMCRFPTAPGGWTVTRVRLIRKLAPVLNGIDLSKFNVGDVIAIPEAIAMMLIREGWAEHLPATPRDGAEPLGL